MMFQVCALKVLVAKQLQALEAENAKIEKMLATHALHVTTF